jgi:hypothetical protein
MRGRSPLGFLAGVPTGHYRTVVVSGLMTGIAAAGPIFAARMAGTGANQYVRALIQRLKITLAPVTPFTAAQEFSCAAYRASGWSAADTGGTAVTFTAPTAMLNDIADNPPVLAINVAGTGVITAGTRTLDTQPFLACNGSQLYAASTNAGVGPFSAEYVLQSDQQFPLNLQGTTLWQAGVASQSTGTAYGPEGIVIQNNILMGAAGVARLVVEMEWVEYNASTNLGVAF